ncbi:MAG: hypothetical protein ACI9SP_002141 [Arenicella sp.]|jgi:hypothetical protein
MSIKAIVLIGLTLITSNALANGYWDTQRVCDYQTITDTTYVSACRYKGDFVAFPSSDPYGFYYMPRVAEFDETFTSKSTTTYPSCSFSRYVSFSESGLLFFHKYNGSAVSGTGNFSGNAFLASNVKTTETKPRTVVIEGSCRFEDVWIKLCNGCQIP